MANTTSNSGESDHRPRVGVAHVYLDADRKDETAQFMRTIGMRPIFEGPEVGVYEMRGGTHMILRLKKEIVAGKAPFDLMVDNSHATHQRFTALGFAPSPIEARLAIGHDVFSVREPSGHTITFFSTHVSGRPVWGSCGQRLRIVMDARRPWLQVHLRSGFMIDH